MEMQESMQKKLIGSLSFEKFIQANKSARCKVHYGVKSHRNTGLDSLMEKKIVLQ